MIKNIIFDLGGVLIKYDPWEYISTLGYEEKRAREFYEVIFYDVFWRDMDLGKYPEYAPVIDEIIERHKDFEEEIRHFFQDGWMQIYRLIKETEEYYYELQAAGYPIYILSNFSAEGFAYVEEQFSFISKAKGRIISSHVHKVKPDPDIYKMLLEKYNLVPEETVFFDDFIQNVNAARELGIQAIHFTSLEDARKEFAELVEREK